MTVCAICGKEFESDFVRAKYCSKACREEAYRRDARERMARKRALDKETKLKRAEALRKARIERLQKCSAERAERRAKEEALREARKAAASARIAEKERRRREALEASRPAVVPEEPIPAPEAGIPAIGEPMIGERATDAETKGSPKFGPGRDVTCAVCGRVFRSIYPRVRYCSDECAARRRHVDVAGSQERRRINPPKETRTCAVCGREFQTRSKVAMFCSDECRERRRREVGRPEELYRRTCVECGREFETERPTRKRCYECSNKDKKAKYHAGATRRCHDCGRATTQYRCPACWAKWRRKHGVNPAEEWDGY